MEIIDELEREEMSYTGSMGYITLDGCCDLNIVIRTLVHKDGAYHLGVGGGITCESEPEFEFEEPGRKQWHCWKRSKCSKAVIRQPDRRSV